MADPIEIDAAFPGHRAKVEFRGKLCFVLSPEKLAGDVKNFRECADLLDKVPDPRAKARAAWLRTLSDEYSQQ